MANTKNISMELIKEKGAIRVYPGMKVVCPKSAPNFPINLSKITPRFNNCYAIHNEIICFVSDDEVFVTPYTRITINILDSAGFCEKFFYVPFSNGDYPKSEKSKWNSLLEKANQSNKEAFNKAFTQGCISYCDDHNIGKISDTALKSCFEIPVTGVKVKLSNFEDYCYYPIVDTTSFDLSVVDYIGHYCAKDKNVIFVYRDGKTYVAKDHKIIQLLESAGFTPSCMFVPFSNGEQIIDPTLKAHWESIEIS